MLTGAEPAAPAGEARPGAAGDHPGSLPETTTEPEREVLTLIATGLSNVEIAGRLHISLSTTKTYVVGLLMKLAARDRAQLVIVAYQAGLVRP